MMKKYSLFRSIVLGTTLLLLTQIAPLAHAGNLHALVDLTGGGMATVPLADAVGGWSFHLDHPLTIAAVGLWDEGKLSLEISHDLGLWRDNQTLLLTVSVGNNNSVAVESASPDGQWLFVPITPYTLPPGNYVMGAVWGDPINGADPFRINTHAVTNGLTYTGQCAKFLLNALELVFPDCGGGSLDHSSFFGPNLAVATPEPSSLVLLLIGVWEAACVWRIVKGEPILRLMALRNLAESHFQNAPVGSVTIGSSKTTLGKALEFKKDASCIDNPTTFSFDEPQWCPGQSTVLGPAADFRAQLQRFRS